MKIATRIRHLFCIHAWANRWERPAGHPEGGIRAWCCTKCGKVRRVQYLPIPPRPPKRTPHPNDVVGEIVRRDFEKAYRR